MAQTFALHLASPRRPHRAKRTTTNKIEEIKRRSPKDARAFDTLADSVLKRLDRADDRKKTPN